MTEVRDLIPLVHKLTLGNRLEWQRKDARDEDTDYGFRTAITYAARLPSGIVKITRFTENYEWSESIDGWASESHYVIAFSDDKGEVFGSETLHRGVLFAMVEETFDRCVRKGSGADEALAKIARDLADLARESHGE